MSSSPSTSIQLRRYSYPKYTENPVVYWTERCQLDSAVKAKITKLLKPLAKNGGWGIESCNHDKLDRKTRIFCTMQDRQERLHNTYGHPATVELIVKGHDVYISRKEWYTHGVKCRENGKPTEIVYYPDGHVSNKMWFGDRGPTRKNGPTLLTYHRNGKILEKFYHDKNFNVLAKWYPGISGEDKRNWLKVHKAHKCCRPASGKAV